MKQNEAISIIGTLYNIRLAEAFYYEFFKQAWHVLEPQTPFLDNWHIKYLCDEIQKEVERIAARKPKDRDIIVNISPRSAKSYIFSIMLCPWVWINYPHIKFINSSYNNKLSISHCVYSRRLIESPWYQIAWGGRFRLTGDQNVKGHFENDCGGLRYATSVSSGISGQGADIITGDDLLDANDLNSQSMIETANDHFDNGLFDRLNDQKIGLRIIVMQRLNEIDPTGHVLKENPQAYRKICIPIEETKNIEPPELRAFYKEGLFFPERFGSKFIEQAKKKPLIYACKYLQEPAPPEGNIFKRGDFRFYQILPKDLYQVQSWDFAVKDKDENDWAVGQVWGKKGPDIYLIAQVRAKMGLRDSVGAVLKMRNDYPNARKIYIEDKANGSPASEILENKISGIIRVTPRGSKEERARAVTYLTEGGNIYLPDPALGDWILEFIEECAIFPNGSNDDQVDAFTQVAMQLGNGEVSGVEALEQFLNL